jgi:hypothetical protein
VRRLAWRFCAGVHVWRCGLGPRLNAAQSVRFHPGDSHANSSPSSALSLLPQSARGVGRKASRF